MRDFIERIRVFFELSRDVIHRMPWLDIALLFFALIWIITSVVYFLIMPIICNFYIVPGIEKKIGKKLGYSPALSLSPFGRYFNRGTEISKYILDIHSAYKKTGSVGLPSGHIRYALKQAGYTIDRVSRNELIFAYAYQINFQITWYAFLIAGAIACYESYILKKY